MIADVMPHPNADRLEVATVSGYNVVVGKGQFKAGDFCVFFPPDNLIPETVATHLGVAAYLKHAEYPGDSGMSKCRIGAARIRGVSSYGFVIPTTCDKIDQDLSDMYMAVRYNPPPKVYQGAAVQERPKFHRYTDIENVQRCKRLIPEGELVIVTEKIHGANCRIGVIDGEIVAGSHRVQVKNSEQNLYWTPFNMCFKLLEHMKQDGLDVILFGEVFGPGVQDLKYDQEAPTFRCFDISVSGNYMPALAVVALCKVYNIPYVPVLEIGPYSEAMLARHTDGKSTIAGHIREGVVIKSLEEGSPRRIVKSVSVDYLSRD
jgi:RNA ligase (TIGR02306 family)